ncbi:MAG: sigma 54-interacting transcriptional regulator [Vicinamibacterales bacterium]
MSDATARSLDLLSPGRVLDAQTSFGRTRDDRTFHGLVGPGPAMQAVFRLVERLAPLARTTLITGATGAGKSALAAVAHRVGPCRGGAQVRVGMDEAQERECLRDGARGSRVPITCFIRELADLPADRQVELVHAIAASEELPPGEGLHVIAATVHPPPSDRLPGPVRADLYHRVAAVHYHLPPLDERRDDIPELAATLLRDGCRRLKVLDKILSAAALQALLERHWAGNVRELQQALLRAVALTDGGVIGGQTMREACGPERTASPWSPPARAARRAQADPGMQGRVRDALAAVGGNKSAAATRLGVSRRALYRMLERLDA